MYLNKKNRKLRDKAVARRIVCNLLDQGILSVEQIAEVTEYPLRIIKLMEYYKKKKSE